MLTERIIIPPGQLGWVMKVAERMGFEISFYRLFHLFYGLKPTLRLLAAATVVMVISAQKT